MKRPSRPEDQKIDTSAIMRSLFGELAAKSIASHNIFLQRTEREERRTRRLTAQLAFAAYVVTRLLDALLEFDNTADSLAGFRWQRNATSKHILALPEGVPEANHLKGILETIGEDGTPLPTLAVSLTAYAYYLEQEGRLEEALDVLALSARSHRTELPPAEIAAYALFAGKLNRLLARWEQALICYQTAEREGAAAGDLTSMLRGRLHQGAVARGQGNLPKARVVAEEVAKEASELGLPYVQCLAYADLSAVYSLQGLPLEGIQAAYAACLVATTPTDRMSALGDLGISLAEIGAIDQARLALELVANANTDFRLRVNAVIELMDVESAVGNRLAFERHRMTIDELHDRMPPSLAVDAQFKIGIGLARFDRLPSAREHLTQALVMAEAHELHTWYFKIEEALNMLSVPAAVERKAPGVPELAQAPVIHEVELGLREFGAAILT